MSERNDPARPHHPSYTPFPIGRTANEAVGAQGTESPLSPAEEEARQRIAGLEREARAMGAVPAAAALFHEAGLLWEDPLRNPRNAALAFQNAYRLDPRHLANIRSARRLFADVGNWQMVLQLLDAEGQAGVDERLKAGLLFEKAQVLEERLSRREEAFELYREVVGLRPKDLSLLVQLAAVFSAREEHGLLVEVYRAVAASLEDPSLKAHYLTQAGLILEERLKDGEAAADAYREAFALDRRDLLLLAAYKRSAERRNRPDELLPALAAEAELLGGQAAPAFLELSKRYEGLGRPDDALKALLAARRASPAEPLVLSALAGIYETEGKHEELADVLLAWESVITDESERVALNLRLAALYENVLKREDDAISRYKAILAKVSGHAQALTSLGKLYFRRQDWEGSLWVLEAELAAEPDPKQKAMKLYKAAALLEEKLNREEDAIARYNQCLQVIPGYLPAQKALTRLFEKQHRYGELAAMYEQDLLNTQDRDQMIATLNRIASIYEDRLSDLDHAVDAYKRILEIADDHLPTLRNLARLYEQRAQWTDLIALHELEASVVGDTRQVLSLRHHIAEIYEEHLKDLGGAVVAYERLLAISPSYLPALQALGRLYAQGSRWEDLIRMYRAEAEIAPSPLYAASLIAKVGELYETKLENENEAIAAYQEVLTLEPTFVPALRALGRIYRASGAWESLVDVLRAEAANRTDPAERSNALFQAAGIWEEQLKRPDLAVQGYQEVLRLSPGHPAAIHALERLYEASGNTQELIAVLDRETQTSGAAHAKVIAYLKLARLYLDRQGEPARAAQCLEAAIALEPHNLLALATLERIRAGDRARRADLRTRFAAVVADGRLKQALRLSAAMDQEAGPEARALELRQALAQDPDDARAAFLLEHALRQMGDFAGLVALFEQRLTTTKDAPERLELAMRLAHLAESRLGDPRKAARYYRLALDHAPQFLPALQGLRRASLATSDFESAREALEAEAQAANDPRGALEAFVAAGRICTEHLHDAEGAAANFRRALERDPLDAAANEGLEGILAARGGAEDLAQLHERRAEARLAQRDLAAAADEFLIAAETWRSRSKDPARAAQALTRALAAQPTHSRALELKGELSLAEHQYADAAAAFSARVQQGGDPAALAALHFSLGLLYQDHLSDTSRASAHLQAALQGNPQHAEALERLATIYAQARNWTGAVDCYKRLLELEGEPSARARHHVALGQIYDRGLNDAEQAGALYRRALELAPSEDQTVELLVELCERTGNQAELVRMLEHQASRSRDTSRTIALKLKAGEIIARSLGDLPRAIAAFRQVADLDPTSVKAHAALADLYMKDAASAPAAVDEHRTVLGLDVGRAESLHALVRLWDGLRQADRAFCAAAVLQALQLAQEPELARYNELRGRLGSDTRGPLGEAELSVVIPGGADPRLQEILQAVGDQLAKLYPPAFESLGVEKKTDRLKADHPIHKAMRSAAELLGVEELEVYQARRGLITVEMGEPLAVCVGPDLARKFNLRDLKFLMGRAVMGLKLKTALVTRLTRPELAELFGACVRLHVPSYSGLGHGNEELTRQLKRVLPRKALRALEAPARALAEAPTGPDLDSAVSAWNSAGNRLGLLLAGDPGVAVAMLLREAHGSAATTGAAELIAAARGRPEVTELISFALSDAFFGLRQRVGPAVG